ncbi:MAG: hypothetical protein EXS10_03250 [Phycisphaerales bacterium]|nr:hypothetical protein [Phycisphaerales bacterium]
MPFNDPNVGLGLGAIIAPAGIIAMMLRQPKGPMRLLIDAGATNPEGARKLHSVGIPREALLERAILSGVVIKEKDGRCWVDRVKLHTRRTQRALLVGGTVFIGTLALWTIIHLTVNAS